MKTEHTGSPGQTLLAWGPILLASWLLLLAATGRPAGAAPQAARQPRESAQTQSGLGTNPAFTHITTEQGLSDDGVRAITQDSAGFLWFGTISGLNRYDGYKMIVYRNDPANPTSLSDNYINVLHKDRTGTLWVGTSNGLNAYDRRMDRFTRYQHDPANPSSLSQGAINAIYEDRTGTLWIGTTDGLNRFDRAAGTFKVYRHDPQNPTSLSNNYVAALHQDRAGTLWVVTYGGGLNRFDPATDRFTAYRHDEADPHSLSTDNAWSVYEDRAGTLWVGTWGGGLNRFDPATDHFTAYRHDEADPHSLSDDRVMALDEDDTGALWVGTFAGGLSLLDAARQRFTAYLHDPADVDSLSHNRVIDIFRDRSGLIWVATEGGGINQYNLQQQAFTSYRHDPDDSNSLASDTILAVYEDKDGILWLGSQERGLDRLDRQTGQITHYPPDPTNPQHLGFPTVLDIHGDHTGALWVATYGGGLYHLNPATGVFTAYRNDPADPHSLSNDTVTSVREDQSGILWVATDGGGLNRFDPASGVFTAYRNDPADLHSLTGDSLNSIVVDRQGMVWAGGASGLNRLDPATGQVTRFQHDPQNRVSLSSNNIFKIYEDRAGALWFGTFGGGLDRFDPATEGFIHYGVREGLADDWIASIVEEGDAGDTAPGNLWIVRSRSLAKLNRDSQAIQIYDSSNGLPQVRFSRASFVSAHGELLIGSQSSGLLAFDPASLQTDPNPPPLVFTDFQLANKPVAIGDNSILKQAIDRSDTIELTYADRVVSLEFAALSYRAPRQNRYRYKLEGFDQDWTEVDATRRLITYTNLNPGTYVFRVTGSNGDGVWNQAGRAITLIITPPWWAAWWFRVLVAAMIVGSAVGIYTWRVASLQRQRRALAALVAERTKELSTRTDDLERSNARLELEITERRRAEAEALRAEAEARQSRDELATQLVISEQIVATLELEPLLDRILEELERLERFDGAAILTLEGEALVVRAYRSAIVTGQVQHVHVDLTQATTLRSLIAMRQPLIVADRVLDADELAILEPALGDTRVLRSWMGIPLMVKDVVIGVLMLFHHEAGCYGPQAQARVQLFANQAALAIENARLYQAAQEAAVLEERNRLAHDLHDAVTQSLFAASLIAEGLRENSNFSADKQRRGLEELRELTRGALAEMRALLYELRPGGLAEKPLGQLLDSLCTAFTNRTRIPVALTVTGTDRLEPQIQEMLYRITQEALNNISKHAAASAARVALTGSPEQVVLIIADDGRGFEKSDGAAASPGMGMGSMHERAARIGAVLRIESHLGAGTTVTVVWSARLAAPAVQSAQPAEEEA